MAAENSELSFTEIQNMLYDTSEDIERQYNTVTERIEILQNDLLEHDEKLQSLYEEFDNEELETIDHEYYIDVYERRIQELNEKIKSMREKLIRLPYNDHAEQEKLENSIEKTEKTLLNFQRRLFNRKQRLLEMAENGTSESIDDEENQVAELARMLEEANRRSAGLEAKMERLQELISELDANKDNYNAEMSLKFETILRTEFDKKHYKQEIYPPSKILDIPLRKKVEKAFNKLEKYFPERKVFGLKNVDNSLYDIFMFLYKALGCESLEELLDIYGYKIILGDEIRELRSYVKYQPGEEPGFIIPRVDSMLKRLDKAYPDKLITGSIKANHGSLYKSISGLYRWFGYPSAKDMLAAYGYTYKYIEVDEHPAEYYQPMLDSFIEKYKGRPLKTFTEFLHDNPDSKEEILNLKRQSMNLFGVSLKRYLEQHGVIEEDTTENPAYAPVNTALQDAALKKLTEVYEKADPEIYGTLDDAIKCLENMQVRMDKPGNVYIKRATVYKDIVIIPYGIDRITTRSFCDQDRLKEVIIKAELKEIPRRCFMNCSGLTSINIPEGVIFIGEEAFANCVSLKSIVLPHSLRMISDSAFAGCAALEDVQIKNDKTLVSENAFEGCIFEYKADNAGIVADSNSFRYTFDNKLQIQNSAYEKLADIYENLDYDKYGTFNEALECLYGMNVRMNKFGNVYINTVASCGSTVTIPYGIEIIFSSAFSDKYKLKKVEFRAELREIPARCFMNCYNLTDISIPEGVESIGERAFANCTSLESIVLPSTLCMIGESVFEGCTALKKIQFSEKDLTPDQIRRLTENTEEETDDIFTEISARCFKGCSVLTSVNIPESIISVGEEAFADCTALESIELPVYLRSAADHAFVGCTALKDVQIKNYKTVVSENAFENSSFRYISDKAADKDDYRLFRYRIDNEGNAVICGYTGTEKTVVIPGMIDGHTVTAISEGAFKETESIVNVVMADSITTVQEDAFRGCIGLEKVHMSDSLKEISTTAFAECKRLREINIPDSLTEFNGAVFADNPVRKIYIGRSLEKFDARILWKNIKSLVNPIIMDPDNTNFKLTEYELFSADGKTLYAMWENAEKYKIPEGVEKVADFAFANSRFPEEVTFDDSVVNIGKQAFYNSGLKKAILGTNVREVETEAFSCCQNLTRVDFNRRLQKIGSKAFLHSPITAVILPALLEELEFDSFNIFDNENITKQYFTINSRNSYFRTDRIALYTLSRYGKTLQYVYNFNFKDVKNPCKNYEYTVQEGTVAIAPYAFSKCINLGKVILPDNVRTIGEGAFSSCKSLKEINFPDRVTAIGEKAFDGTDVQKFVLGPNVSEIGISAFVNSPGHIRLDDENTAFSVEDGMLYRNNEDGSRTLFASPETDGFSDIYYVSEDPDKEIPEEEQDIYEVDQELTDYYVKLIESMMNKSE